ncbi:MAG: hypothetical protein KAS11_04450 [Candidatus Aenigmarchaeota archaeon]|nr:hypothetical protein [Candidatus Aenigmarchaeota archaeon]
MDTADYHQNLIEMSFRIMDLNHGLFGAKVRLNQYKKKDPENFMEKMELYPLLKTLKNENSAYNSNTKKEEYDKLEDITLEDYETFETIIKKIDENEKIDKAMILEQNIALTETDIVQYLTDINTAGEILLNWQKKVKKQKDS